MVRLMTKTTPKSSLLLICVFLLGLSACRNDPQPAGDAAPAAGKSAATNAGKPVPATGDWVGKPGAPFAIRYTIIGTPIVGSPVSIDLEVRSNLGPLPVRIGYAVTDETAMMLHEAQPPEVQVEAAGDEAVVLQRVTVVPIREGRLYLNVTASTEGEVGTMSTVIAIPIQVGEGGRELEQQGRLETDESGETVRVLDSD